NLLKEDIYAVRIMRVFRKSGEKVNGLATIRSFDPVSNAFIMEGVSGEPKTIFVSDIDRIEFEQDVQRRSPQAQISPWRVMGDDGRTESYGVPPAELKIKSGKIEIPLLAVPSPSAPQTPNTVAESSPEWKVISTKEIPEPRILQYDVTEKNFRIEIQYVTYVR